jgi:hypothetical protein
MRADDGTVSRSNRHDEEMDALDEEIKRMRAQRLRLRDVRGRIAMACFTRLFEALGFASRWSKYCLCWPVMSAKCKVGPLVDLRTGPIGRDDELDGTARSPKTALA